MKPRLEILSRPGCHLCETMHRQLRELVSDRPFVISMVNVDDDPELETKYGQEIPVLLGDGRELCRHRLDLAELEDFLARH